MNNDLIKEILQFMQRNDPNGFWMEWLQEIQESESTFDVDYVIKTLNEWHKDSNNEKFSVMAQKAKDLKSQ